MRYSIELKRLAVSRVVAGERLSAVARIPGHRQPVLSGRPGAHGGAGSVVRSRPARKEIASRSAMRAEILSDVLAGRIRIAELERKIGQQEADLDFFRQALRHVKARQQEATGRGALRSTKSSSR